MKKITSYLFGIAFVLMLFASCKATKGCGLTSDAQKIETSTSQILIVAEV